jgi:biotin operon repressor
MMSEVMLDLNEEIWKLKERGMSLRLMAATLNMSHEGVRKRLKALERGKQVSTGSNAHKSRTSEELKATVNQVSTQKTSSLSPTTGVNPFKTLSVKATDGKKEGNSPRSDDLVGEMLRFLESKGIEVYRMQNGGYQVKGNREIVRFYITRRDG